MKYHHHPIFLAIIFLLAVALGIGAFVTIEESRSIRNEYSFDVRQVTNPSNELYPVIDSVRVVTSVQGHEVSRATVSGGLGCAVQPDDRFVFAGSISELTCSAEGNVTLFVMHETGQNITAVDRYELTDNLVETPGPEHYRHVDTIFEGNNE